MLFTAEGTYDVRLRLGLHALTADATDPQAAHAYLSGRLRGEGRGAFVEELRTFFAGALALRFGEVPAVPSVALPDLEGGTDDELPATAMPTLEVELSGPLPAEPGPFTLRAEPLLGAVVLTVRRAGEVAPTPRTLEAGAWSPPYPVEDSGRWRAPLRTILAIAWALLGVALAVRWVRRRRAA